MSMMYSRELPNTSTTNRGNIRRSADPNSTPQLGINGCLTLYECLRRGAETSPLGPCLGRRAVSNNGFATPFVYSSYTECVARVDSFACGLERLNLLLPRNSDDMLLLGIYMKNCMEWVLAEHAIYTLGGATVPLYDTLGPDTVQFVLHQTEMACVVCTRGELPRLCAAKKSGQCPAFRVVILIDGVVPDSVRLAREANLEVISFAKVEAVGAQVAATEGFTPHPPNGKDVATFCYTSGTTGNPKGALITHENLTSSISGVSNLGVAMEATDRHLSYLPLPHIFERVVLSSTIQAGGSVGFSRGDPLLLVEDIVALRPTILPVAPRVLNKIYDKIHAGIAAAGGLKKKIFDAGLAAKSRNLAQNGELKHSFFDAILFNKIKVGLGMDCLRLMVSGSAPLSSTVMTFWRCVLGVPVIEGYGQTEGTAAATLSDLEDMSTVGHVGGPVECVEIVLADVPEMGYMHTDTLHRGEPCCGRGEILVRGPAVFKGYYKDEEKTKETIDEDGWLLSGDIGLWTPQGQLQIIDRKKNIFKLAQGEYVAAEKIENVLIQAKLVGQCFVYGDSYQSFLVAIIVPDEDVVRNWATEHAPGLAKASFGELCRESKLREDILLEIKAVSKSNGLHGFETVRAIYVENEPFSDENGLVTPTFKLKRQQLRDRYESEIANLYAKFPPVASKL
eukprot:CAMPEP_0196803178 /NCGR_PEP_ID=MMETSP1362-20130617/2573_1 /TAXON_ID=163516 /ORGANISM="Leptocylindrus danicus, Strain CCMP1856" /LENGTH=676 /DNA_ID=CAMNT_0042174623 /DNA_START=20 /DNA_END=2050 /DNA_ORIENTATION=-